MGFLLLVGCGAGAYAYFKLTGNIKSDDLSANGKNGAGKEKPDAFGRTPINILVIGSDARADAADKKLGGAADSSGARADVEMVLHISADRSNATVMSIPRDLVASWSGCHDKGHASMGPQTDQKINAALNGGPGCSVDAVHQLTGITIDHFMMVDFDGVVKMSNAVGGVPICVDNNVYDPYSHLKLKKGDHTLKGDAALEFLRTRHGFGDSSDSRGRTVAQHIYLNSLVGTLKSHGTLSSPTKLWKLANAATSALTVDNSLDSPSKLIGLANDLNKVPQNRITYATLQTYDTTVNGVSETLISKPSAPALFKTIIDDQSLTTASGGKTKASAAPTVPPSTIAVTVQNGTETGGRAGAIAQELIDKGFSQQTTSGNGASAATTLLSYPAGEQAQAQSVAKALGLPSKAVKQGTGTGIVLLIGNDWTTGTVFPGGKAGSTPADTKQALDGANSKLSKCAHVSTFDDVIGLNAQGRPTSSDHTYGSVSPTRAYALSSNVKDSAP
ncbi:transcriptional attenuator, LytR family [Actinacidiphila yanglinensis]|uniref:Transcriptional attenuator, LytR family n=1 Tax=Actinacidiphila yanglinensis TaxID=310779 RepID=A0A1H6BNT3_9ACTN|nr:LCP family protein [Actinacidiphila yanglinensis]SEG62334.1 transcriptional attenuator, LytR family [Actinacidiphila yanglinensis]